MKKIVTLLLISIPLLATAQAKSNVSPYAKGAVNTENGMVVFEKSIEDKSHSQAQLFQTMKDFLGTLVVMSENEDRSKVTKEDSGNGILEAQVEEMLYFKPSLISIIRSNTVFWHPASLSYFVKGTRNRRSSPPA